MCPPQQAQAAREMRRERAARARANNRRRADERLALVRQYSNLSTERLQEIAAGMAVRLYSEEYACCGMRSAKDVERGRIDALRVVGFILYHRTMQENGAL